MEGPMLVAKAGRHGARCRVRPGATLGATRMYDLLVLRTYLNSGQQRGRGHGLI